jgi:methionine sulfoxide reductase heme-binding subunit
MKKVVLFFVSLFPFFYLVWSVQNAVDPIKYIYTYTGLSALAFLLFSLSIYPIKSFINLLKYRKMLGLFSLFYLLLHVSNFILLDAQLDMMYMIREVVKRPFISFGMIAFLILLFMGITSTKKLYVKYSIWHKLVYIALLLALMHEVLAQKVIGIFEYFLILISCGLLGVRGMIVYKKR